MQVDKKPKSLWMDGYLRLKKNKASMVSFWFIFIVCIVALFAKANFAVPL